MLSLEKSISIALSGACVGAVLAVLPVNGTFAQSATDRVAPPLFYNAEANMRSVLIGLEFRKDQTPLVRFAKVINGPSKTFKQSPRGLRVDIIGAERIVSTFNFPDPFVLRQWEYPPQRREFDDGTGLRHRTIIRDKGRARIVFPFDSKLQRANIIDEKKGALIISVDLKTMVSKYCDDPQNKPFCTEDENSTTKADLFVKGFNVPIDFVKVGEALENVSIDISNRGNEKAIGTEDDPASGYVIDLVMSKDDILPSAQTSTTEVFVEDNALRGGNIKTTPTLGPGDTFSTTSKVIIPEGTPPGWYCLGVLADSTQKIAETNESNNSKCFHIKIIGD